MKWNGTGSPQEEILHPESRPDKIIKIREEHTLWLYNFKVENITLEFQNNIFLGIFQGTIFQKRVPAHVQIGFKTPGTI